LFGQYVYVDDNKLFITGKNYIYRYIYDNQNYILDINNDTNKIYSSNIYFDFNDNNINNDNLIEIEYYNNYMNLLFCNNIKPLKYFTNQTLNYPFNPTLNLTLNPTFNPSIESSLEPTINQSIEPSIEPNLKINETLTNLNKIFNNNKKNKNYCFLFFIIEITFFLIIITIILFMIVKYLNMCKISQILSKKKKRLIRYIHILVIMNLITKLIIFKIIFI
jgi:hypothetical protein